MEETKTKLVKDCKLISDFYECPTDEDYKDLSNWNVSNVTNMSGMFCYAENFNSDLSNWNVSKVTNNTEIFYGAKKFKGPEPAWNWNVCNVR